ncbi:MAG: YlxR family protein [Anaerostipes sp.]|nr:YlxR family protein [Anaerostipes sp.]
MSQKTPKRQCIGCHESKDKKELVRIVKEKNGNISFDPTGKKNGRGAYICNSPECLDKSMKSKGLNRAFKMEIPEEVYEQVKKEMINYER